MQNREDTDAYGVVHNARMPGKCYGSPPRLELLIQKG